MQSLKKSLHYLRLILEVLILINLGFATAFNWQAESQANYEYFQDFHYFSAPICGFGTFLCILLFWTDKKKKEKPSNLLHFIPFIIITIGTLASGTITYTGEDSPSFWVILLVTIILLPVSIFFIWKMGRYSLIACFVLLYSPSLAYYSAQQWVLGNTQLFGDEISKIEGWNFEVDDWKWFNLEVVEKKHVIVYNWFPFFRRFAIKHADYDPYGKGQNADILYSVEKIDGKLLITQATHVWWNSSGETGVWPSR